MYPLWGMPLFMMQVILWKNWWQITSFGILSLSSECNFAVLQISHDMQEYWLGKDVQNHFQGWEQMFCFDSKERLDKTSMGGCGPNPWNTPNLPLDIVAKICGIGISFGNPGISCIYFIRTPHFDFKSKFHWQSHQKWLEYIWYWHHSVETPFHKRGRRDHVEMSGHVQLKSVQICLLKPGTNDDL